MTAAADLSPCIDESLDEQRARQRIKLIRKLRWIGEEAEAELLSKTLLGVPQRDCVLSDTIDTD